MVAADVPTRDRFARYSLRDLVASPRGCLERVQGRVGHDFSDLLITRDPYEQFAKADVDPRHLITEPGDHPAELAELISRRLDDGHFRYPDF